MRSRWRTAAVLGLAVVVLGALAVVVFLVMPSRPRAVGMPVSGSTPHAAAAATTPLTEEQALSLATDLTSGDEDRVRSAVAVAPGQKLNAAAVAELESIKSVDFDLTTFRDRGDGTAQVRARILLKGAGSATTWAVGLVDDHGTWRISWTEPVR